ncbi:MAG: amidase domain-containing protein [Caldisericum sp.]|uniref:amidase domain-containing protein n=1 Tax=Caldisericum sp. TaxID=2499687 RepID=UPI003D09C9CC
MENSTVRFLSSFYEIRSEAIVNSSKANIFLNNYSEESIELRKHEINRINFYQNWIKQFDGTINEMHSDIYAIKDSFQVNNNKASIKVYEWITILWTREKENIDVNNLPVVKELEKLYQSTDDLLLKKNLPYRIKELKMEIENTPTNVTSGIGVYHSVVLLMKNNSFKILKDSYDEGKDLTRSPDFIETNQNKNKNLISSKGFSNPITVISPQYYPQTTFNSDNALWYADQCVADYRPDNIEFDYYNLNYVDCNSPSEDSLSAREYQLGINIHGGGGDCTNYVSQCLFAGGERMIKNSWYYDNHGTGITDPNDPNYWNLYWMSDDNSSPSWRSVPDLRNFILNYLRGTISSNFTYAVKGDLVENGYHVMIVHGNSGSSLYIDAHNNDRKNFPISYSWLHNPTDGEAPYEAVQMYHLYPLILNGSDDFFYPQSFPIIRMADRRP